MQSGIIHSQEKQEDLVLGDTKSKVLHPFFNHFVHVVCSRPYRTLREDTFSPATGEEGERGSLPACSNVLCDDFYTRAL